MWCSCHAGPFDVLICHAAYQKQAWTLKRSKEDSLYSCTSTCRNIPTPGCGKYPFHLAREHVVLTGPCWSPYRPVQLCMCIGVRWSLYMHVWICWSATLRLDHRHALWRTHDTGLPVRDSSAYALPAPSIQDLCWVLYLFWLYAMPCAANTFASQKQLTAGAYGADLTYISGFGRSYAHKILIWKIYMQCIN